MSPEATNYLNDVLDRIQQHSIMREKVDWETLRRDALLLASHAQTTGETYPAIELVLERLGDQHSNFLDPEEATLFFEGALKEPGLPDQPIKTDWKLLGTEHDPVLRAACHWLLQQEECLQS